MGKAYCGKRKDAPVKGVYGAYLTDKVSLYGRIIPYVHFQTEGEKTTEEEFNACYGCSAKNENDKGWQSFGKSCEEPIAKNETYTPCKEH